MSTTATDRPEGAPPRRNAASAVPRWAANVVIGVLAGAFVLLPERLLIVPRPVVPALILLAGAAVHLAHGRLSPARTHTLYLIVSGGICVFVGLVALTLVAVTLPFGSPSPLPLPEKPAPLALLLESASVWGLNVLAFALLYWTVDAGGPMRRRRDHHASDDFLFPQMTLGEERARGWSPDFLDYLFLAFNASTAFSPTDTLVLSRTAKVLMMVQSLISLTVIAVLVARGINTLQ